MKVIFNIVHSNSRGGMENVYLEYCKILNKGGYRVIAIISKEFVHLEELKKLNIETEILNISGHYDFLACLKLLKLKKKYKPNLLITHNGRSFAVVNFLRFFRNIKTIAVSHGGNLKRLMKFDYVITVSKHIEERLQKKGFRGKIQTIYNGIKLVDSKKTQKNKNSVFGVLARFTAEKNVELAIKSFAKFLEKQDGKLILAGDGEDRKKLEKLVQDLRIKEKVEFVGWIKNKQKFFNQIDILINPSNFESYGLSILEAMNYGILVISSDACGPKEIIKNGKTGFLFKRNEQEELAGLMLKIVKQDNRKIINQAKDSLEGFSYQNMEESLVKVVREFVAVS